MFDVQNAAAETLPVQELIDRYGIRRRRARRALPRSQDRATRFDARDRRCWPPRIRRLGLRARRRMIKRRPAECDAFPPQVRRRGERGAPSRVLASAAKPGRAEIQATRIVAGPPLPPRAAVRPGDNVTDGDPQHATRSPPAALLVGAPTRVHGCPARQQIPASLPSGVISGSGLNHQIFLFVGLGSKVDFSIFA